MQSSKSLNSIDVAIGKTVGEQRMLQHKSIAQAAEALGMSQALYVLCEAGERAFQAGDLFTLADYFGIRARDLMPTKEELVHVDATTRYGDPQEVRDLIYHFSGVVSPSLRSFFLKQIADASIQGERSKMSVLAPLPAAAPPQNRKREAPRPRRKALHAFSFLRAS